MPRNCPGAPEDRIRIQHMMDAARQAIGFAQGKSRKSLDSEPMLARALMHAILEIGEAASRTSDAGRSRAPEVPWAQIVGMRNVLIHVYMGRRLRPALEDGDGGVAGASGDAGTRDEGLAS